MITAWGFFDHYIRVEPAPNEHRGPAASIFHKFFAFFFGHFPFKQAKVLVLREKFYLLLRDRLYLFWCNFVSLCVCLSVCLSICLSACLPVSQSVYIQAIIILFARLLFPRVLNFFYLDVWKQVMRGHNIVVDGWAGASILPPIPHAPTHTQQLSKTVIYALFDSCPRTDGPTNGRTKPLIESRVRN